MIPIKPIDATWTDEQWQAIYEDNSNIIVSAGAGSGKTAVLSERVIRKLKDGVHINELLILTFTKAAAAEMADRIRKKIKKNIDLTHELELLDSAYITTFDSFVLSVVKKYHYLINMNKNIGIIDASLITIKKKEIIDNIFTNLYETKDKDFLEFIGTFCIKEDTEIREAVLKITNKLDLLVDKYEYLENYLEKEYSEENIHNYISKYMNIIYEKINNIYDKYEEISYMDNDYATKIYESIQSLNQDLDYNTLKTYLNIKLPNAPRGSDDELKNAKAEIKTLIDELKELCKYDSSDEIRDSLIITKNYTKVIINIILKFMKEVDNYKNSINSFEFTDIAIMAIKMTKKYEIVREELKNSFKEIMIDEYQDTSDLQEIFINLIENNNVYMVGDVKQSIYRFRNANPLLFKNKYDNYANKIGGIKLDLNKNFRSRSEVLDNINLIFDKIMTNNIGGANYIESHRMIFGNKTYLKEEVKDSNDLELMVYEYDKDLNYSKEEIEAFIIAKDIQGKIKNKRQVLDKDEGVLRNISYNDFSIIMDRSSSFDLYRQVFNYFNIPITILKDERLNDSDDVSIISNIIRFIIKVKEKNIDTEFKYLFTSIARSYLFNISDNDIFNYFYNNNFKESNIYQKAYEISKELDSLTPTDILYKIIDTYNYYELYLTTSNINKGITIMDNLMNITSSLEDIGYDIYDFSNYLKEVSKQGLKIEFKNNDNNAESVKIMTIHKSKGLEYPICYFSGMHKSFNIKDIQERYLYDNKYGIITPYFNEGICNTIKNDLLKRDFILEEVSEKIRLFYVALTRAREKMIIVSEISKDINPYNDNIVRDSIRINYKSLLDIIASVKPSIYKKFNNIDINSLGLTHEYTFSKKIDFKELITDTNEEFYVNELNIHNNELEKNKFSKNITNIIDKKTYNNLQFGKKIHEYLELIDFKNPNLENIDEYIKEKIQQFLNNDLLKNIQSATIYKEYEFIYEKDTKINHGIIDLMLEYDDYIDIIDYKLKNINDKEYLNQLNGYANYIKTICNKKINLYLYSIIDNTIKPINIKE